MSTDRVGRSKTIGSKLLRLGGFLAIPALVVGVERLLSEHGASGDAFGLVAGASGLLAALGIKVLETAHAVEAGLRAHELHDHRKAEQAERVREVNEDLARAVGTTIGVIIRKELRGGRHSKEWNTLAETAEECWVEMARETAAPYLGPLAEPELVRAIEQNPYAPTFVAMNDRDWWEAVLYFLAKRARLDPEALGRDKRFELLVAACDKRFCIEFYNTLKHDFETGGRAFAGITLRVLAGILFQLRKLEETQPAANGPLRRMSELLNGRFNEILAHHKDYGAYASFRPWLDDILNKVDAIARGQSEIRNTQLEHSAYLRTLSQELTVDHGNPKLLPRNNFADVGLVPNRLFVGRRNELDELHRRLIGLRDTEDRRFDAVVHSVEGDGGIGKTELVTAYAFEGHPEWEHCWWISGSKETIDDSCQRLARFLGLDLSETASGSDVRAALRTRFAVGSRHLLIIDNAERAPDPRIGWSAIEQLALQPPSRVLVTTRWNDLPTHLAEPFELGLLSKQDARQLLRNARNDRGDSLDENAHLDEICEQLGYHALALGYAAAWLANGGTRTATELLSAIKNIELSELHPLELQALNGTASRYQRSTAAALSLHLPDFDNTPATDLLTAAAFCYPERIPLDLLAAAAGVELGAAKEWFSKLASRSLVRLTAPTPEEEVEGVGGWIALHRLTQSLLRHRCWTRQRKRALKVLSDLRHALLQGLLKDEDAATFARRERLAPHAAVVTGVLDTPGTRLSRRRWWKLNQFNQSDLALMGHYLARQLHAAGELQGADEQISRIIRWGESQSPRDDESLAMQYADRATIRRGLMNLRGAEDDINVAINSSIARGRNDGNRLSGFYAERARIRLDVDDFRGAENDIEQSIRWTESRVPRNEESVASLYSIRASVRLQGGNVAGAKVDINYCIQWFEAHPPHDESDLASLYSWRSLIRDAEGDVTGKDSDLALAERHITASIDRRESQRRPRNERALALQYLARAGIRQLRGDLSGAEVDVERCIKWSESQKPREEHLLAAWYVYLATLRAHGGRTAEAEKDITWSLAWGEAQKGKRKDVAQWYAARSIIRMIRGDAVGADLDITRSIEWGEAQTPKNERELGFWYERRADIRRERVDLAGAENDITRCIEWGEAQTPKNERELRVWYERRAGILRERVDLAGAENDITRCIEWGEAQAPKNERDLGAWYQIRAGIREDRGDLAGAERDIGQTIELSGGPTPENEERLGEAYATRGGIRLHRGDLAGAESDITWSINHSIGNATYLLAPRYALLAAVYRDSGRLDDAEKVINQSIDLLERERPQTEQLVAAARGVRARIRAEIRNGPGAQNDIEQCIEWWVAHKPGDEKMIAIWRSTRAMIRLQSGDVAGAENDIESCIQWWEVHIPEDRYTLAKRYASKATILEAAGRLSEAGCAAARAVAFHVCAFGSDHEWTAKAISQRRAIHEKINVELATCGSANPANKESADGRNECD